MEKRIDRLRYERRYRKLKREFAVHVLFLLVSIVVAFFASVLL